MAKIIELPIDEQMKRLKDELNNAEVFENFQLANSFLINRKDLLDLLLWNEDALEQMVPIIKSLQGAIRRLREAGCGDAADKLIRSVLDRNQRLVRTVPVPGQRLLRFVIDPKL